MNEGTNSEVNPMFSDSTKSHKKRNTNIILSTENVQNRKKHEENRLKHYKRLGDKFLHKLPNKTSLLTPKKIKKIEKLSSNKYSSFDESLFTNNETSQYKTSQNKTSQNETTISTINSSTLSDTPSDTNLGIISNRNLNNNSATSSGTNSIRNLRINQINQNIPKPITSSIRSSPSQPLTENTSRPTNFGIKYKNLNPNPNTNPNTNTYQNTNTSTRKVLIVVDVQNCFIPGGSLDSSKNKINNKTFIPRLGRSIHQIKGISNLINKHNDIVFTKNFLPIDHYSFLKSVYQVHCRNETRKCQNKNLTNEKYIPSNNKLKNISGNQIPKKSITMEDFLGRTIFGTIKKYIPLSSTHKNVYTALLQYKKTAKNEKIKKGLEQIKEFLNEFNPSLKKNPIIGTNLSYLYYFTKYSSYIDKLIKSEKYIGLYPVFSKETSKNNHRLKYLNSEKINIPKEGIIVKGFDYIGNKKILLEKTFMQLIKGQYCMYEAYSAFNYHIKLNKQKNQNEIKMVQEDITNTKYKNKNNNDSENVQKRLKKYSTGLFEYILQNYNENKNKKETIEISVCGLFGEIGVIHTVLQGLIMWNNVYQSSYPNMNVRFKYCLQGTLFLGKYGPFQGRFIPNVNNDENTREIFLTDLVNTIKDITKAKLFDEKYIGLIDFKVYDHDNKFIGNINKERLENIIRHRHVTNNNLSLVGILPHPI
jgi:nicotinamidase-related amidase